MQNGSSISPWLRNFLILLVPGALAVFLPEGPVDAWHILDFQKISTVIFVLALLQLMASFFIKRLGSRAGVVLVGFLAGLVSSTAVTATIARQSLHPRANSKAGRKSWAQVAPVETLMLLAATLAMLTEALVVVLAGARSGHLQLLTLMAGPMLATLALIYWQGLHVVGVSERIQQTEIKILPLLKLTAFIIVILAVSKVLRENLGDSGLLLLTFGVSLFEIHGSLVANVQLHNSGSVSASLLAQLITVSVMASYLSKILILGLLGHRQFALKFMVVTAILFASLGASYLLRYPLPFADAAHKQVSDQVAEMGKN